VLLLLGCARYVTANLPYNLPQHGCCRFVSCRISQTAQYHSDGHFSARVSSGQTLEVFECLLRLASFPAKLRGFLLHGEGTMHGCGRRPDAKRCQVSASLSYRLGKLEYVMEIRVSDAFRGRVRNCAGES
jgi:hypothetical protein